jgi:hypothetical protein
LFNDGDLDDLRLFAVSMLAPIVVVFFLKPPVAENAARIDGE